MKKTLLALAVAAFTMSASAASYELDATTATDLVGTETPERPAGTNSDSDLGEGKHVQPLESLKIGDFSFTFSQGSGSTAPAYYYPMSTNANGKSNIRVYKNNEMTITGPADLKITGVSCTGTNVDAVTFTCDGTNVVTFSNTTGQNVRFQTFTINTDGTTPDPNPTPDPEVQQYTVAEVLALDVASLSGANAWVKGYVVGSFNGMTTADFTAETGANASVSNLAIAATVGEDDVTKMVAVQLPVGDVRTALNLKDNAGMLGKEVNLYGTLEKYFGIHGLKNVSKYEVTGGLPEVEVKETATLTSFIEEQDENNFYKILGAVTVVYQSGSYLFITDGTSNLEVYGKLDKTYKNGDRLTGIIGKFGYYMNMPQMSPKADSFGDATEGTAVTPAETSLDKVQLAQYVTVKNVSIVADGDKWNVTDGTTTLQIFNRFNIEGIKGLEGTTITGIGAVYDETKQLFPITIEGGTETGDTPEPPVVEPGDGITIMANQLNPAATTTVNGFTFSMAKNDGATAPAYYDSTADIRLYAKNTLTISGGTMAKIVFTLKNATYRYTTFTPSTGALNPAQAAGDTEITWEGNANEVTFTVGDIATLGTENTKPGQIKFTQVTIYGEAGSINEIRFDENGSTVIYNLRGQRLSAPVKGINIINGKKVLVK